MILATHPPRGSRGRRFENSHGRFRLERLQKDFSPTATYCMYLGLVGNDVPHPYTGVSVRFGSSVGELARYLTIVGTVPLAPRVWLRRQSKSHKNYLSSTEH